jgi:hypothetical protein
VLPAEHEVYYPPQMSEKEPETLARRVSWTDSDIHHRVQWRDGDIVVSVPAKSGTTWTMNIVHQLREGGDPDLQELYAEVPWLEFVWAPTVTPDEHLQRIDGMPRDRRRAFKTHAHPGEFPFQEPGVGRDVDYIVVMRNPDEAIASFYPFLQRHSEAWLELWGASPDDYGWPDFETYFDAFARPRVGALFFEFLAAWWPLRNQPNVLFLHFSDMKRDHQGTLRKVAGFLGYEPTDEQWRTIEECTSFRWMKAHQEKFEIRHLTEVPVLQSGAMIRKGKAGTAHEDGMTAEFSAQVAAIGRDIVGDPAALEWFYRGGPITPSSAQDLR